MHIAFCIFSLLLPFIVHTEESPFTTQTESSVNQTQPIRIQRSDFEPGSLTVTCGSMHNASINIIQTCPGQPLHPTQPLAIKRGDFNPGSLTVICGSMCSGKSEELIRLVKRFVIAGFTVLACKPAIDTRKLLDLQLDPHCYIPSRTGNWMHCTPVHSVAQMAEIIEQYNPTVIAIDEVNFFIGEHQEFITLIQTLINKGKKILISGLDLDFKAEPFAPMPELLALADQVLKLTAICSVCGDDAFCITQRLIDGKPAHYNDPLIVVGSTQYEPRCRKCHRIQKD